MHRKPQGRQTKCTTWNRTKSKELRKAESLNTCASWLGREDAAGRNKTQVNWIKQVWPVEAKASAQKTRGQQYKAVAN